MEYSERRTDRVMEIEPTLPSLQKYSLLQVPTLVYNKNHHLYYPQSSRLL